MPETESLVRAPPPDISLEVAAGLAAELFGVTGSVRWRGSNQDLVAVAKAMGNGHPLGAVITTPRSATGCAGSA
jgi:4-aminobutyrate aminotransferase-like enzyme